MIADEIEKLNFNFLKCPYFLASCQTQKENLVPEKRIIITKKSDIYLAGSTSQIQDN